jgi:hypothetical protein
MSIHGHRLKKLPQTALLLARHYQGWKTADMMDELAREFDDPFSLRTIQRYRVKWSEYETVDDNPLVEELGWTK